MNMVSWDPTLDAVSEALKAHRLQEFDSILGAELYGPESGADDRRLYDAVAPFASAQDHPDHLAWSSVLSLNEGERARIAEALWEAVVARVISYEQASSYAEWLGNVLTASARQVEQLGNASVEPVVTTVFSRS
jgi:hypothetical protein